MKKRIISLVLALAMLAALGVTSFAAIAPSGYNFYHSQNSGKYLNAYTDGFPVSGTNVTTYNYSGTLTQQWKATYLSSDRYYVEPAAYTGQLVTLNVYNGYNCNLYAKSNNAYSDYSIKFVNEGNGNYGLVLADRYSPLCLTESSSTTYGGYNVIWSGSNGLNNQLWK